MRHGFTLIELMVVIVVIGILAVLGISKIGSLTSKARVSEIPGILSTFEKLQVSYISENSAFGNWNDIYFIDPNTDSKNISYDSVSGIPQTLQARVRTTTLDCSTADIFKTTIHLNFSIQRVKPSNKCGALLPNF